MKCLIAMFVAVALVGGGCSSSNTVTGMAPAFSRDDALDQVRAEIVMVKADVANVGACHDRMHAIGRGAYETFGIAALDVGDEWCNAGYVHGVIEVALAASDDPVAAMRTLCDPFSASSFSGWECRHGVGHGLMYYTNNDLPRALEMCGELTDGSAACVNGVWMENFVAEENLHPTDWRHDDTSFYPCEESSVSGAGDCYLYAPVWRLERNGRDYAEAFEWCLGADGWVSTCVRGVGAQAMKDNVADPEDAVSVCAMVSNDSRQDCIAGMTGILAFHHASVERAVEWCKNRSGSDRTSCDAELKRLKPLFD